MDNLSVETRDVPGWSSRGICPGYVAGMSTGMKSRDFVGGIPSGIQAGCVDQGSRGAIGRLRWSGLLLSGLLLGRWSGLLLGDDLATGRL